MAQPSIPQGTRDFSAETVRKRQYILDTIRTRFEKYGFEPLETPAMENLETLTGKYGEEGDRLIFKILNNGLHEGVNREKAQLGFEKVMTGKSSPLLTERALKYDLTIPFARYVAMNHGKLTFPYKRYQIQPVWRADRPQKGRYREFTQCDADVVGSNSLLNEVELIHIYHDVFCALGLSGYRLLINSRKILTALADVCGAANQLTDICVAIDKLDKIGLDKVLDELKSKGLHEQQTQLIAQYLNISGNHEEKLEAIQTIIQDHEEGRKGLEELRYIISMFAHQQLKIDVTLARGLNYYTGLIFEVKAPEDVNIGSIGGGGRYDNLTGLFGLSGMSGVGISFGVDRIYDVLENMECFPADINRGTEVMFMNMGEAESRFAYDVMQATRASGFKCEIYPESIKMDKQFKYADKRKIRFAVIIGSKEMMDGACVIKNLEDGKQQTVLLPELCATLHQLKDVHK